MLRDASRYAVKTVPSERGAEWSPRCHWNAPVSLEEALARPLAPNSEAVEVYVNEGRWVVGCPDCAGAQLACRTDPRFMCVECANVTVDGMWRPVVWPKNPDAVDAELAQRRMTKTRNWLPGETVAQLRTERLAHEGRS